MDDDVVFLYDMRFPSVCQECDQSVGEEVCEIARFKNNEHEPCVMCVCDGPRVSVVV